MSEDIKERLLKIADAAKYTDGTDSPLAEQVRAGAAHIEALEAQTSSADDLIAKLNGRVRDLLGEKEALETEIAKLTPYAAAFRREEDRADKSGREIDDLKARLAETQSIRADDLTELGLMEARATKAEAQLAAAREAIASPQMQAIVQEAILAHPWAKDLGCTTAYGFAGSAIKAVAAALGKATQ